MANIPVISPDGTPGSIPEEQKIAAMAQGYTLPNQGTRAANAPPNSISEGLPIPGEPPTRITTPLINNATGEEELVPSNEANKKFMAGTHSIPGYVNTVRVVKNDDNVAGSIPRAEAAAAVGSGQYRLESQNDIEEADQRKRIADEIETEGTSG